MSDCFLASVAAIQPYRISKMPREPGQAKLVRQHFWLVVTQNKNILHFLQICSFGRPTVCCE